jgi:hypothetical protein
MRRPSRTGEISRRVQDQLVDVHQVDTRPVDHPRYRHECRGGPRPCPLVGCFFNNYLEVRQRVGCLGSQTPPEIRLLHPHRLPEDMPPADSCTLDLAEDGPQTLDRVGQVLGLTRERIRQIETKILERIARSIKKNS